MGLIFLVSAQEALPSIDSALNVVLKKAAHMAEFGVLWALWLRALAGPRQPAALRALAITLAYAVSDELHQSMVDGRTSSPFDVAIDAAGIGIAVLVWQLRATRARKP